MGAAQRVQLVDEFRRRTDGTSNVLIIDGLGAIYTLLYPKVRQLSGGVGQRRVALNADQLFPPVCVYLYVGWYATDARPGMHTGGWTDTPMANAAEPSGS